MPAVEELDDVEAALVDVKMDVPLFKIRSAGLPDLGLGVHALDLLPSCKADTLAVRVGRDE